MKETIEWVKKHPLILVLGAGALILVFLLFSGGSSTATTSGGTGVDPNADALAAQQSQIAAQAGVANNQTAAQLAAATLAANVQTYQIQEQTVVAQQNTQASEDVALAGIQGQVQLADIAAQTNQAQIAATTNQAQIASSTYEYIANTNATSEEQLAAINASQNVSLAQISSNTTLGVIGAEAGASEHNSDNSLWSSLGGLAVAALSFL